MNQIIITDEILDGIKENEKGTELYKVMGGYLIDGKIEGIPQMESGDLYKYMGHVNDNETNMIFYTLNGTKDESSGLEIVPIAKECVENYKKCGVEATSQNEVVSIIHINKKEDGRYESKKYKMSFTSFTNMYNTVLNVLNTHKNVTDFNSLLSMFDKESDEYSALTNYSKLLESHCFSFVLYEFNIVENSNNHKVRVWNTYDFNDVKLRSMKAFDELHGF